VEIEASEAQESLSSLLDRVQQGEQIEITRHGNVVARLVPSQETIDRVVVPAALARIRANAAQAEVRFDWAELKADRDRGRP
jgi:prevent-host-death family protein